MAALNPYYSILLKLLIIVFYLCLDKHMLCQFVAMKTLIDYFYYKTSILNNSNNEICK